MTITSFIPLPSPWFFHRTKSLRTASLCPVLTGHFRVGGSIRQHQETKREIIPESGKPCEENAHVGGVGVGGQFRLGGDKPEKEQRRKPPEGWAGGRRRWDQSGCLQRGGACPEVGACLGSGKRPARGCGGGGGGGLESWFQVGGREPESLVGPGGAGVCSRRGVTEASSQGPGVSAADFSS